MQIDVDFSAIPSTHIIALESRIKIDIKLELSNMTSPQRCRLKHIERSIKIPSLVLHLKREISEQIVNSFSIVESIGAILVGVSNHISHSKSINRHCREINPTKDDDLTISRQLCKTSNYPRITILNNTTNLSLNIDRRFSCIVSVQSRTHGDC